LKSWLHLHLPLLVSASILVSLLIAWCCVRVIFLAQSAIEAQEGSGVLGGGHGARPGNGSGSGNGRHR
jgi:hypothetical protein